MLKMKSRCEQCNTSISLTDVAYICSYECTFCTACNKALQCVCPNCKGKLVLRPTRTKSPVKALVSQVRSKLLGH